jgi:phage baseplate assembly protein W
VDLVGGDEGAGVTGGVTTLIQSLKMRLLVDRGELEGLGHDRYGSRIRDLLGQTLDAANLELLRRIVRRALLEDPRVTEVVSVTVRPGLRPGTVDVTARVRAPDDSDVQVEVTVDAG